MGSFKGKSGKSKVSAFARAASKAEPKQTEGDVFDFGKFRVGFLDCSEGENGAFCLKLTGLGKDKKIGERIQWFSTAGKAGHVSAPRAKSMCMMLAGLSDVDEYNEFDPHGEFINAIFPYDQDAAAAYLVEAGKAKNTKAAIAMIVGAEFGIKVSKGGERDDGDFFRNASFFPLEDADGEEDDTDEEDEDDAPESEPAPKRKAGKKTSKRAPVEEDEDEEEDDVDDSDEEEDEEPESEPAPKRKAKARRK